MANWGACEVIEHHQEIETDPHHYIMKGAVMQGKGDYEEAEKAFLNAIKYEASDTQKNQYTTNLLSMYYRSGRADFGKKADRLYDGWWGNRKKELLVEIGALRMCLGFFLIVMGGIGDTLDTALPLFGLPLVVGAIYVCNLKRIETVSLKKGIRKMLASTFVGICLSIAATVGWAILLSTIAQILLISDLPYLVSDSINFGAILIGILIAGMGVQTMLRSMQSNLRKMKKGSVKSFLNFIFTIARIVVVIIAIVLMLQMVEGFTQTLKYHSRNAPNMVDQDGYFD